MCDSTLLSLEKLHLRKTIKDQRPEVIEAFGQWEAPTEGFPKVPQRSEDNFGKPLDALDGLPPEGTRKSRVGARSERSRRSNPRLGERTYSDTERNSGRRKRSGSEA